MLQGRALHRPVLNTSPPQTMAVFPLRVPSRGSSRRSSVSALDCSAGLADCPEAAPSSLVLPCEAVDAVADSVAKLLRTSVTNLVVQTEGNSSLAYRAENVNDVFTLGEVLGQGSYGTVRAALHKETGQEYAIKILQKRRNKEDRTDVIENEIKLWHKAAADASEVVQLHSIYQDDYCIYIAQELCTGGDLQTLLDASGKLDEAEAAQAMHGVLSALAACHAHGICYGDVKPANFMLSKLYPSMKHILDPSQPKGQLHARMTDFGCAQFCPDGCSVLQGLSGTPAYMAPEIIVDHCYHLPIDIWAAGVMLYQLLTGRFPFWDTDLRGLNRINPRKILEDVKVGQVLLDVEACTGLSAEVKDLISAMLQRDVSKRLTAVEALQHPWFTMQLGEHASR